MPLSQWARNNAIRRQTMLMTGIEMPFKRDVFVEKNRYIRATAKEFKDGVILSDEEFEKHQSRMTDIFNKYHKRSIVVFNREVLNQAKSARPMLEIKISTVEGYIQQWFTMFGGANAKEVAGTTKDDIKKALTRAFESDEPESKIVTEILRVRGLSAFRAETIARTETHNAAMFSSMETAKDINLETQLGLHKKWNPVQSDRTRSDHIAMTGSKPIPMDNKFFVGGEFLDRPGLGSAHNSINCRCVLTYEIPE